MKFGFVLPDGNARTAADVAKVAEEYGWDGFFVWEPVYGVDAWVALTAAAMQTNRIKLGTMLTPISRMRPWELAGKANTLDHLSAGRVIVAVGLGALDVGFAEVGEETDRKIRAELMDDGLEIMLKLWSGKPFSYTGKHYTIKEHSFMQTPPPVQTPSIPLWVVGLWGAEKSMDRAVRYTGLLPYVRAEDGSPVTITADMVRDMRTYATQRRDPHLPFDIVIEGATPGDNREAARAKVAPLAEAGATWWIESMWDVPGGLEAFLGRLRQGPPRID